MRTLRAVKSAFGILVLALAPITAAVSDGPESAASIDTAAPAALQPPTSAAEPTLSLSVGTFGLFDDLDDPYRLGVEFRSRPLGRWLLAPGAGLSVAANGAFFLYAELRRAFALGDDWAITPSFGAGYFHGEDDLDLGHELEFQSGIEVSRRFDRGYRVGLAFYHLSNASLSDENPGTEVLALTLTLPLGRVPDRSQATGTAAVSDAAGSPAPAPAPAAAASSAFSSSRRMSSPASAR